MIVLDTGALVALDRNDRDLWIRIKAAAIDDVVDASVALVAARPGVTHVYTSDPDDLRHLLGILKAAPQVIRC